MRCPFHFGAVLSASSILFSTNVAADYPSLTVLGGPVGP